MSDENKGIIISETITEMLDAFHFNDVFEMLSFERERTNLNNYWHLRVSDYNCETEYTLLCKTQRP